MNDPLLDLLATPPAPAMSVDSDSVIRAGRARVRRRRLVRALATAAVLCAVIAGVTMTWPSSRPDTLPASSPTTVPTAADAVTITRADVVEVPVPGADSLVLYAHLLPDGIPGMPGSTNAVVIAWEKDLPDPVVPGETVLLAADFVGRSSVPTRIKVDPSTGIGVLVTPAQLSEIEVTDGGTTHRAGYVDIGQGYRVFVVTGLAPRPWNEDGPPLRPVR